MDARGCPFVAWHNARQASQLKSQRRADDVDVSRLAAAIVLPHVVKIAGDVLVEGVARGDGCPGAYPVVHAPVIKDLFRNEPDEFRFLDLEWMLQPHAIAIAPRIDLRLAPPSLEPIAIAKRELSD